MYSSVYVFVLFYALRSCIIVSTYVFVFLCNYLLIVVNNDNNNNNNSKQMLAHHLEPCSGSISDHADNT
jgi:hypothetical protein